VTSRNHSGPAAVAAAPEAAAEAPGVWSRSPSNRSPLKSRDSRSPVLNSRSAACCGSGRQTYYNCQCRPMRPSVSLLSYVQARYFLIWLFESMYVEHMQRTSEAVAATTTPARRLPILLPEGRPALAAHPMPVRNRG